MDKQKVIFDKLVFGPFPGYISSILHDKKYGDAIIYREGGYKVSEPLENGKRVDHDMILLLSKAALRLGKVQQKDVIGIEIKTSSVDLMKSDVSKYLGATRLYFIAAPQYLLSEVVVRYSEHPKKGFIGIIDSDTGEIVVLPQFQAFSKKRQNTLLSHCYSSSHRIPCLHNTEPYEMARVNLFDY